MCSLNSQNEESIRNERITTSVLRVVDSEV